MKIKSVCEATGLTDRTVRFYIEQKLIFPSYTENYLGRKTFDFSDEDVESLNCIAVLRKFGFSVDEIRDIIQNGQKSREIVPRVRSRVEDSAADNQKRLSALSRIDTGRAYSLAELAAELSRSVTDLPAHNETVKRNPLLILLSALNRTVIFAVVWTPILLCGLMVILGVYEYYYPVFHGLMVVITFVTLIPSFAVLIVSRLKFPRKNLAVWTLLILCIYSIPISAVMSCGIVSGSETDDFANYRMLDVSCGATRNGIFQELFPTNVNRYDGTALNAEYYYRYANGFLAISYDIYAQWSISQEELVREVERVRTLFESKQEGRHEFTELTRGSYKCLMLSYGCEPFTDASEVTVYNHFIFAYDEESCTVRYVNSYTEGGGGCPYYLGLDW